jgi:hypothetical protein
VKRYQRFKAYQQAWRKKRPHYSRDKMRIIRGSRPGVIGRVPGRRVILGVPVQVNLLSRLML